MVWVQADGAPNAVILLGEREAVLAGTRLRADRDHTDTGLETTGNDSIHIFLVSLEVDVAVGVDEMVGHIFKVTSEYPWGINQGYSPPTKKLKESGTASARPSSINN